MEDKKHPMPDKETFLAELRKAEDPEQMSWLMANYLMDKVHHKMRDAMPEPDEDQSYGHTWDSRYSHGMTGTGRTGTTMRRGRSGSSLEEYKERLGEMLGQSMTEDDIKCLICKEAASIIKRICKDEPFEAFKEFAELCIGMKAYAEQYPEDLEEQAKEEAIASMWKCSRDTDTAAERCVLNRLTGSVRMIWRNGTEKAPDGTNSHLFPLMTSVIAAEAVTAWVDINKTAPPVFDRRKRRSFFLYYILYYIHFRG